MLKTVIIITGMFSLFIFVTEIQEETNTLQDEANATHVKSAPSEIYTPEQEINFSITQEPADTHTESHEHKLETSMVLLLEEADQARNDGQFQKSLSLYNQVIETLQSNHEYELEKLYAKAQFSKALLLEINLENNYDAIICYQTIAKRFEKSQDLTLLLYYSKAQFAQARMVDQDKALEIYDEIIAQFTKSNEIVLLQKFAQASFEKSYFSSGYEAIDIYDDIIQHFQNSEEKDLLESLYNAQMNKAYILEHYLEERDETLNVYDQVIEKFSNYQDSESKTKVDNALFSKSFLLMGEADEEAMEIFDILIERYKNNVNQEVPENLVYAIVNNIELSLITNNDDSEYQDLAQEYLADSQESQTEIEMLNILRNAQEEDQSEAIERWENEHKDFQFENWSFKELEAWNAQMEESETKTRIRNYLDRFIKHYNPPVSLIQKEEERATS